MSLTVIAAVMPDVGGPYFYLPEPSLVDLADAAIQVGGLLLPVHSQLLSMQSGVLRELFRGARESGGQVGCQAARPCVPGCLNNLGGGGCLWASCRC